MASKTRAQKFETATVLNYRSQLMALRSCYPKVHNNGNRIYLQIILTIVHKCPRVSSNMYHTMDQNHILGSKYFHIQDHMNTQIPSTDLASFTINFINKSFTLHLIILLNLLTFPSFVSRYNDDLP